MRTSHSDWKAPMKFRLLFAIAVALTLTAMGCSSDSDDAAEVNDTSAPTTTAAAATTTTAAATTTAAPATTTTAAPPTSVARRLNEFERFADGTYTMEQLGVPVTFTVTGEWHTQPVGPGFFVITTPDSAGPGDHDIVAIAPTQLFDAATGEPLPAGVDLAGWLDSVPATATISEVTVGEIGGVATTVFTVDVGDEIVYFADVDGELVKNFLSGFIYEVHWVEHPDGPITFVIGTPVDDLAWLDTARGVVETIELG
jgi:hypothetical protein